MNKEQFLPVKWKFWHYRKRSILMVYLLTDGPSTPTKGFPYEMKSFGSACYQMITDNHKLTEFSKKLWNAFQSNPQWLLDFMLDAYEQNKKDIEILQKLHCTDFSNHSSQQLSLQYKNYIKTMLQYKKYAFNPLAIEAQLDKEVRKHTNNITTIFDPIRMGDTRKEELSLLHIASEQNQEKREQLLDKHIEQFSYLKQKGMLFEFYDKNYYHQQLKNITDPQQKIAAIEQEQKDKQKQFQEELLKHTPEIQTLFKVANEAVLFRSWRSERLIQSSFYVVPLFTQIAKQLNLSSPLDIAFMLPDEVTHLLENEQHVDHETINLRKENYTYLVSNEGHLLLEGNQAIEFSKQLAILKPQSNEITGTAAFEGVAQGKVIVVKDKIDYEKIRDADILVVHATLPEMVPYFTKLKAIIAEEGGILSHAAVISREMKIPSLIGAANATQLLKTGDVITLDTSTGKITKQ